VTLLEEIEAHPRCGDGDSETLLQKRGATADERLEALCLSRPDLVREIHADYVKAGARIIRTNTFGANNVHLGKHGLSGRVNEINWQAAQLARQAAKGVFVAGSVGPLAISSSRAEQQEIDREECFRTQIGALLEGGVDLICFERFQDVDELLLALHVKQSLHHCPAICSLVARDDRLISGGISVEVAFESLARHDAEILGVDCVDGPEGALRLAGRLLPSELPLAVFPDTSVLHPGHPCDSPEVFAQAGVTLAQRGVRIIGGGRGSTPAHIAALSTALADAHFD
jgi:methionine synthase / methylenetetrahydrofolate reductase(NADPH)